MSLNLEAFLGKERSMVVRGLYRTHDSGQDYLGTHSRPLGTNAEVYARVQEEDGGRCCPCPAGIFWGT